MFFIPGKHLRVSQELFYQLAITAMLIGTLSFTKIAQFKLRKINLWLGIFGIYTVCLFALDGTGMGNSVMLNTFSGLGLIFIVTRLRKEDTEFILKTVIWVCAANILYLTINRCGYDFIYTMRGPAASLVGAVDDYAMFGLKAVMGMWMGLGMVAVSIINPILSICFLLPIYLSKSSGVILGICTAVPFFWYHTRRRIFWIVTPLILVGSLAYVVLVDSPMGMMNTRPPMWKMVIHDVIYSFGSGPRFLRNPILGFGLDSFRHGKVKYCMVSSTQETVRVFVQPEGARLEDGTPVNNNGGLSTADGRHMDWWDNPHNEIVQLIYEFGFLGLFIVSMIIYQMVQAFRNSYKDPELVTVSAMLVFLFFASMSQFPFHLARIGFLLPVLVGLFINSLEDE